MTSTTSQPRSDRGLAPRFAGGDGDWRVLTAIVVLAAALFALRLGTKPFWLDETVSALQSRLPLADNWHLATTYNVNMGVHYLLLQGWAHFGESEWWLRTPSVIFAAATVLPTYGIGRMLFGRRAGLIAAAVLAVNPFLLQYAQEARGYALAGLASATATWCLVRVVDRPTRGRWVAWVAAAGFLPYTHFFGLLVLLALAVATLLAPHLAERRAHLLASFVATGVLASPIVLFIVAGGDRGQADWIPDLSPVRFFGLFPRLAANDNVALAAVAAVAVVVALATAWRLAAESSWTSERVWPYLLVVSWLIVPVVAAAFVSLAVKPMFVARFFIVVVPPLALLVGVGLASLRPGALRTAIVVLFVASTCWATATWYVDRPKEGWRAATRLVLAQAREGDALVVTPSFTRVPVEWYARDDANRDLLVPAYPANAWGRYQPGERVPPVTVADAERFGREHERVWLFVRGKVLAAGASGEQQRIRSGLSSHHVVRSWSFTGLHVELLERADPR